MVSKRNKQKKTSHPRQINAYIGHFRFISRTFWQIVTGCDRCILPNSLNSRPICTLDDIKYKDMPVAEHQDILFVRGNLRWLNHIISLPKRAIIGTTFIHMMLVRLCGCLADKRATKRWRPHKAWQPCEWLQTTWIYNYQIAATCCEQLIYLYGWRGEGRGLIKS